MAGGLRGEAVKMVRCKTIDVEVPATAEIVIEGRTLPGLREDDGPFGEYPGTYSEVRKAPVVMTALLAANIGIKLCVVVDEDIDVHDMQQVEGMDMVAVGISGATGCIRYPAAGGTAGAGTRRQS